jgi:hypothetical protein
MKQDKCPSCNHIQDYDLKYCIKCQKDMSGTEEPYRKLPKGPFFWCLIITAYAWYHYGDQINIQDGWTGQVLYLAIVFFGFYMPTKLVIFLYKKIVARYFTKNTNPN